MSCARDIEEVGTESLLKGQNGVLAGVVWVT